MSKTSEKVNMDQLVECIPNFSEARRPEVIDSIAHAITEVEGLELLDRSSDLDHNRTVITFAGTAAAVEESAFRAIKKASELIDLRKHQGEHPRIGAADVVPFVPLTGISMDECVAMARRLGQRVGEELRIPVYLYEHAATRPDRTDLENIRRGQYEVLKDEIAIDPDRAPDFGPARLGSAGATAVGARDALIAFNVYLTTPDVEVARRVARAIRHSSGGLRFVKALGMLVEGRAQVSINLTNFRKSPIARVVELIRREARRHGADIHHSELVGLIPQEALVDAAVWYTQLDAFDPSQVLESRLRSARLGLSPSPATTPSFVERIAAPTASPGGGSVAAQAGAMAAALVEMVAGLTVGKGRYRHVEAEMTALVKEAHQLRVSLGEAVEDDAVAFAAVMAAYGLPKDSASAKHARADAIGVALMQAARVPLRTAKDALRVMDLAASCVRQGNANAISDALTAAAMARAAITAAGYNVRLNLRDHPDVATSKDLLEELSALEAKQHSLVAAIRGTAHERAGLDSPAL